MSNSPFPGMDPYLERFWRNVHHRLVTYACDQIQPQLPPELRARMEERVFVTGAEGLIGHRVPEVQLTETYIEIIDAGSGNRVVSAIEFLSPTNKLPGEGRDEYLRKRTECRQARVPLVEIDLTRQGRRKEVLPLRSIPAKHHATYLACVERY